MGSKKDYVLGHLILNPDDVSAVIEKTMSLEWPLENRIDNLSDWVSEIISCIDEQDHILKDVQSRKSALSKISAAIKSEIQSVMLDNNLMTIKGDYRTTVSKPSVVCKIVDESLIPDEFTTFVKKFDLAAIKKNNATGTNIPGSEMIDGSRKLTIKKLEK